MYRCRLVFRRSLLRVSTGSPPILTGLAVSSLPPDKFRDSHSTTTVSFQMLSNSSFTYHLTSLYSLDGSVGITTIYWLDGRGSISSKGKRYFSAQRPDRFRNSLSLSCNIHRGKAAQGVKLTTHLHRVPRSRMVEICLHSPLRFNGVVLNLAQGQFYLY
jgi:hypothetical protein